MEAYNWTHWVKTRDAEVLNRLGEVRRRRGDGRQEE